MGIKFSSVKVGDVLYSVWKEKMGSTTMRRTAWRAGTAKEIDPAGQWVMMDWGAHGKRKLFKRHVEQLRRSKPKVK